MIKNIFSLIVVLLFTNTLLAQSSANSSIASGLGLYVFPSNNQSQETQNTDETACYSWAKQQTGYDPMNPTLYVPAQASTSPDGTALVGSAVGAGAGAAIGAIAGNAGEGAAIGAVLGALRGRRAKVEGDQAQQQQNNQAAAQATANAKSDYSKAFSACMDGKGYTVK
ncbi:glycine zipper domain-containing protein [Formosa sp. PL04]|uniref:glycine zipper domain-containing protein n=1 Tax=Formosa sp. PL04 TaxID=3081755 RepID=UPI002980C64C|nr:glycine zipper domain-containing protein [Formosa sp. PL04]MDW5288937.1 glycine zipper domain-containing protein [Formosa sp. PL04]